MWVVRGVLVAGVFVTLVWNWPLVNMADDWSARQYGEDILQELQDGAYIFGYWDTVPVIQYLQLVEGERPDVKDSTYDKALETEEQIQGIFPNTKVYIRDLNVWDPTDFSQILPKIRDILFRITDEMRFEPNRAFYINATSATPQIQASCILAVTSGTIEAKVLQVANPKYAPAPERVREMPITLLQEDSFFHRIFIPLVHVKDKVLFFYSPLVFSNDDISLTCIRNSFDTYYNIHSSLLRIWIDLLGVAPLLILTTGRIALRQPILLYHTNSQLEKVLCRLCSSRLKL